MSFILKGPDHHRYCGSHSLAANQSRPTVGRVFMSISNSHLSLVAVEEEE